MYINVTIAALYLGAPEHEARVLQELVRHQPQHPRPVRVARTQHLPDLGGDLVRCRTFDRNV